MPYCFLKAKTKKKQLYQIEKLNTFEGVNNILLHYERKNGDIFQNNIYFDTLMETLYKITESINLYYAFKKHYFTKQIKLLILPT